MSQYDDYIKSITYDELIGLFDSLDTALVYIGGEWCYHCNNVIGIVVEEAKKYKLDHILNYDPVFTNIYGEKEDLRDCKSLEIKLKYYAIVEKSHFKSTELVRDTLIPRIHIPFFMAIRNGTCVGYYTIELIEENGILHEINDIVDQTEEFRQNIDNLISKLKFDDIFSK